MAGLLDGVLPYLYSQGDRAKKLVGGLLADPVATFEQSAGQLIDKRREDQALQARAFSDTRRPFNVTDQGALGELGANYLGGLLGFAPVGMLAGVGAKTADLAALEVARKRLAGGEDPALVWKETGWGKGPDGKMRFEIDDSRASVYEPSMRHIEAAQVSDPLRTAKVSDVLTHRPLYGAYPSTQDIGLDLATTIKGGAYAPAQRGDPESVAIGAGRGLSTWLHELQHAVQTREGFSRGGDPKAMPGIVADALARKRAEAKGLFDLAMRNDPLNPGDVVKPGARAKGLQAEKQAQELQSLLARMEEFGGFDHNAYRRLGGEAEARLVESRMNMTPAQRAAQYPWEPAYFQQSTGTPLDALIFR